MSFRAFPRKSWKDILPLASEEARDLVTGLVKYQSTSRLNALEVSISRFARNDWKRPY